MLDPGDIRQLVNLPPEDAIRFLDAKGYRTSVRWTDTWADEHAAAFTAAKVAQIDLLREIHVSLIDAMATGQTFERWQADLRPKLAAAGWWGRVIDPEITGTDEAVIVAPRRLRTIYDTNLRMARATALWGRIVAARETLPFLRYSAVMDRRTRPQHRLWHDIVLPVEHPFWQTHFPPNGWNCRCTVVQLSARALERRGLAITTEAELTARGFGATPVPFWRKGSDGRPGQIEQVPPGIDPGFAYNPGTARARLVLEKAADSLARAASVPGLIEPALADIMETLPGGRPEQARVNAIIALARAGQVAELAAALAELLTVAA
jgi:SPP1 gp7 family putative phage head morphogenesis protein